MPLVPFEEGAQDEALPKMLDLLCTVPIFDDLRVADLTLLAKHMTCYEIGEGDVLFVEGERGHYVCFVVEGELEVSKVSASGTRTVLTRLSRGQSIGEMAVIDEAPRSATVTALTASRLLTFSRGDFEALLDEHPAIGIRILKGIARVLSRHLRRASGQLAERVLAIV
ncbi:MAG TPA: cyclic nucleotide-binding domain-containing protein [Candidatus Sulfotelmatobacter sp.]|nr:cyclic nucleotide-binding domain-containing protein [Candidatus Sulfotelmatobacter sp.]